ncbi:MAG: hypothetical protein JJ992_16695, partial [Planctomycetes bacterium]|nr:hypothetical protein [Planctomycetota bacterium]
KFDSGDLLQRCPEFRTGTVFAKYTYAEPGYDSRPVKDSVVDIYDEDAPTVIVDMVNDGSIDVIEGAVATDEYRIRLSRAPVTNVILSADAVKTRTTYGRTAEFEVQVSVSSTDDFDGDPTKLVFTPGNWDVWRTVTVSAIDDNFFDGNDTQVFAPDLQTVNKIRGPLIIEGAAGAGSLSLPRPVMLPDERSILAPDGLVQVFSPGSGAGAVETMDVLRTDLVDPADPLKGVLARLQQEDSTITSIQDLVGKTIEMSSGPGTGVVLDPRRPEDLFDRFWLIVGVEDLLNGNVRFTLQNPSLVDPGQSDVTAPDTTSKYAITSLSLNFFADEREQVDYLFVYDDDSVADDEGALTSADGVVRSFAAGAPATMQVETAALQAVAKLADTNDLQTLVNRRIEITVGPGQGRSWRIASITIDGETRALTLEDPQGSGSDPTDRSEFRIAGGDTHGRIIGFGMGPNILFGDRPQPGGISYGDIEVVQVSLGRGNDQVRVDYATNAEDHTTKRSGDFYTLTMLDTGAGDDQVTVDLQNDEDGAFSLNLNAGDDQVNGSVSTGPLVVFGWTGNDTITGGSGGDILFGDIGRVDYVETVAVDNDNDANTPDVMVDQIVTRLGHSVVPNPVNPPVTGATLTTLSDANTTFATTYGGLVGLSVQAISPDGHVQYRTIVANDAHTVTIDRPWDQIPVFNHPLPDPVPKNNYYYRISAFPEDQTD